MNGLEFQFRKETLIALPSGALWWDAQGLLCVSDLHLGKSERVARRTGTMLPPYESRETLERLADDIARTDPREVVCLGDSFDDLVAARDHELGGIEQLIPLMAGRRWVWIEGNHDPGPVGLGGEHRAELQRGPLSFRHIATESAHGEVSGHYHPKARLKLRGRSVSRRCFLVDDRRLMLPAYGTYTGGLESTSQALSGLMAPNARAILLSDPTRDPVAVPMPRPR